MTKANELRDAKVNYISFVKRGANKDPLRVIKDGEEEEPGLDLSLATKASQAAQDMGTDHNDKVAAGRQGLGGAGRYWVKGHRTANGTWTRGYYRNANGQEFHMKGQVDLAGAEAALLSVQGLGPVVFFSVTDEADADDMAEIIDSLGYKADTAHETPHGLVFMQMPKVPADTVMAELAEGIHVAVQTPVKKAELWGCMTESSLEDAQSFSDIIGTQGALPMMNVALDALREAIGSAVRASATPDEARTGVVNACQDFTNYAERILDMIPLGAFKAEAELAERPPVTKAGDAPEEKPAEGDKPADGEKPAEEKPAEGEVKKDGEAPPAEGDKPKEGEDEKPAEAKKEEAAAAPAVDVAALTKSVTDEVSKLLAPVTASVQEIAERVGKTEKALGSSLVGGKDAGDASVRRKADQPDNGTDDFSFDTAYGRRP